MNARLHIDRHSSIESDSSRLTSGEPIMCSMFHIRREGRRRGRCRSFGSFVPPSALFEITEKLGGNVGATSARFPPPVSFCAHSTARNVVRRVHPPSCWRNCGWHSPGVRDDDAFRAAGDLELDGLQDAGRGLDARHTALTDSREPTAGSPRDCQLVRICRQASLLEAEKDGGQLGDVASGGR